MKRIDGFVGQYRFLSNFFTAPFIVRPYLFQMVPGSETKFQTVEHYYQSAKPVIGKEVVQIAQTTTPDKAKQMGNRCSLRADWDVIKLDIMREAVTQKFIQNPKLAEKLTDTFPYELIHRNDHQDTFWGVYGNLGHNHLGVILEEVRLKLI